MPCDSGADRLSWTYSLRELAEVIGAEAPGALEGFFSSASTDSRTLEAGSVFFALSGENFDGNQFVDAAFAKGASAAVCPERAPAGDARPRLVVANPLEALQRFAAWHRSKMPARVIAITGSAGKTTTKDFIAAVLGGEHRVIKTEGNLNNEIGCPLSLLRLTADTEFAVMELGANHVGEIAMLSRLARPDEALITLVAPAHLEGFGSIENIAAAKGEIVRGLSPTGVFYLNVENSWCIRAAEGFGGTIVRVGKAGNPHLATAREGDVTLLGLEPAGGDEMILRISPIGELRLPLACPAHAINVLFAVACGLRHGVRDFETPLRTACAGGARFKQLTVGPLTVIDDSYNANPASMEAAIESLGLRRAPRLAALGDMLELGPDAARYHFEVGALAGRAGVEHVFARGAFAEAVCAGARAGGASHATSLDDHEAIARAVAAAAVPGSTLLVKGSRGMRMERVIEALRGLYS